MRSLKELLTLTKADMTNEEWAYLQRYKAIKRVRHSPSFVYHSRKLPEEPDGTTD